jgi:hypothetical protein
VKAEGPRRSHNRRLNQEKRERERERERLGEREKEEQGNRPHRTAQQWPKAQPTHRMDFFIYYFFLEKVALSFLN